MTAGIGIKGLGNGAVGLGRAQGHRISKHLRRSDRVVVVPSGAPEPFARPGFFLKKGGVGCFLRKMPRMLLIGFELGGGYLCVFARFCDTFGDVLASEERREPGFGMDKSKDKDWAGLCGLPPLPQEQRHGKDGAPGQGAERSGGLDEFSNISLHCVCPPVDYFYCAPFGVNCMQG